MLPGMSVHRPLGATESGAVQIRTRASDARSGLLGDRLGRFGIVALLATTLVVALAAAHTNLLLPESVRPMPSWLAGPFGSTGIALSGGAVIALLAVMFVSYVLAVRAAERLSARTIL